MPANFLKNKQVVNVRNWHLRKLNVGYGTRDKVVLKQSNKGKVYFLVKTYDKDIGELRSEVAASAIGKAFGFPVQRSWLCQAPQHKALGLSHSSGVLIQLDVRRQKDTRRKQFREDLVHGAALIALIDKSFGRLKNEKLGRRVYTLDLVIKALRNYVAKNPSAKIIWEQFFELLVFDALIGGTDRHYHNWGVLVKADNNSFLRLAPAFDNGISLLWMRDQEQMFMRDLLGRNYPRRAPSMFKKNGSGKYTLYEVLEALYAIDEYRGTELAKSILKRLNEVRPARIKTALYQNIPTSVRFKTKKKDLGLICMYATIRLELLKEVLGRLVKKYKE